MNPLARFTAWLAGLRFTVATITVTIARDTTPGRSPGSPAERELRELALDHSLDARRLLEWLDEGGLVLRPLGPISADPPRDRPADALEDDCRDPGDGKADALCSECEGCVRVPVGGKPCERWNGPLSSTVIRLYGPHHQRGQSLAGSRFSTGRTGSYPQPEGEAS